MIKFEYRKEETTKITVAIKGNVQEYALSFLHIWNNAREHENVFLKVENNSSNLVYVSCKTKYKDSVREYLEDFGTIRSVDDVVSFFVELETDFEDFAEVYGNGEDYREREFYIEGN